MKHCMDSEVFNDPDEGGTSGHCRYHVAGPPVAISHLHFMRHVQTKNWIHLAPLQNTGFDKSNINALLKCECERVSMGKRSETREVRQK